MTRPLSEPDFDRQQATPPDGPTCSRCGNHTLLSVPGDYERDGTALRVDLYACPTDGEFYLDREGWSTRQVFLDDSAPTVAVPVEVAVEEEEQVEF